jgi:hypothetical protein
MSLLDGYLTRRQLAIEVNRAEKTIERWERLPDGLPCTMLGGRKLYKKTSVLAWIESRECRPNPRRRGRPILDADRAVA